MDFSILKNCKITRVLNAVAAGTSDQNCTAVDMSGFDGVCFIALFGTLTATQVTQIKGQQGTDSTPTDAADLTGSNVGPMADGDSNKMLILDIYRPEERYVRLVVDRGTANAVIDGVIAIQYRGKKCPITQPTSVSASEFWSSPIEGTA